MHPRHSKKHKKLLIELLTLEFILFHLLASLYALGLRVYLDVPQTQRPKPLPITKFGF